MYEVPSYAVKNFVVSKPKTALANPFHVSVPAAPFTLDAAKYRAVEAIRLHGKQSRTSIADLIGYSPSKMTSVVNDLIDEGLLTETGEGTATGGRRARTIDFNPDYGYFAAATVEVSRLDIALVDFCGNVRVRRLLPMPHDATPQATLDSICGFILERLEKLAIPLDKIYGVGLSTPVPVEPDSGTLNEAPELPGWGGYQIDSQLREVFPYGVVIIEKDANAMAYAELRHGQSGADTFVYIKPDAPVSVGIVIGGQIYHGASGRAGDIGGGGGAELASLIAFLDPALVIIGGASDGDHQTFAALSRQLLSADSSGRRRVERSALGAEAAMTGIIARIADRVFVEGER